MAIPVALQNFKAAGVYKVVYDKSTILGEDSNILRLVVGFSEKGPFNTPTYVTSVSDFKAIYGDASKKLEKRGCYFHRIAIQCLTTGPILCLNLKKFDNETLHAVGISTEINHQYPEGKIVPREVLVEDIYDTTRFWTLDATKLNEIKQVISVDEDGEVQYGSNLDGYIKISATNDISTGNTFFIRKANGSKVNAYNVTVNDWYKDAGEDVPDYLADKLDAQISDFFAEIYVFGGEFTKKVINASDTLSDYLTIVNSNGEEKICLKSHIVEGNTTNYYGDYVDTLDALYEDSNSGAIAHYVGALIPYFKNKIGQYVSLDILFNQDVDTHNMMMSFDTDGLDDGEYTLDLSCSNDLAKAKEALTKGYSSVLGNFNSPINVTSFSSINDKLYTHDSIDDAVYDASFSYIPTTGDIAFIKSEDSKYFGSYITTVDKAISEAISTGDMFFGKKELAKVTEVTYTNVISINDEDLLTDYFSSEDGDQSVLADSYCYLVVFDSEPTLESAYTYYAGDTNTLIRVEDSCNEEIGYMYPIYLEGYEYKNSKPESTQMLHKLEWQNFQLSALSDYKGLRTGLMNKADIDFRYIIDGFETYVDQGVKSVLCGLAKDKQNAFAILNFPSVQTFMKCPYSNYTNDKGIFNPQYVVDGYNKKKAHSKGFSLPSDSEGASFCAFYTPLKFSDGYIDSIIPSAGLVSNLYINKYTARHPYDIVAGPNYGAISASGLVGPDYNYSMDELQIIEPFGVNCMIYRPSFGTFINANQTAKQTPKSALSSVNVRELVIYLQDEIEKLLQSYQWEFNNATIRSKIKDRADSICTQVQQNGGIQDFVNVMDESNNTSDIIDNEMAVLSTHIEPGRGMGKMVHELTLYRTGQMRSFISE
jgi:hypothetical protein